MNKPRAMPSDEESLEILQAAWTRLDPRNKGTILATQMLDAVDIIEEGFGMVPGKFISRRGRAVIAEFAAENPKKRITLEKMVGLFEAFDKSMEYHGERSVSEWANQEYSDYYGDAQRVSEIQTPAPEGVQTLQQSSPPPSPKGSRVSREQSSFPDILGDLPNVLPELDQTSPTRTSQQAPLFGIAGTQPSSPRRRGSSRSVISPAKGSGTSREGAFSAARSTPLRSNRRSWAKSNDEAFFEKMTESEDMPMNITDGDTDSLMKINHRHMNEINQLREYADFCETQIEDSSQRHDDLEKSILAKTKECREAVKTTKAHQEGLEQVSHMIFELTEMLGRKGKRNSRTGSVSSNDDVLEAYKGRLEEQLEALGKSGEMQEAEIKRLTEEKRAQQEKVESLEAQIQSLTTDLSRVSSEVVNLNANREKEDFVEFEARLQSQGSDNFSSISDILEQQNLIINDLKEKLVHREQQESMKEFNDTIAETDKPEKGSKVSIGVKNMFAVLLMVMAFHLISEIFFPANLPEGVVWWMNAPGPIQRTFAALDAWVARNDEFRVPM